MTPLYTVLMGIAGLALAIAVCGLAVLARMPRGPRHVKRARGA